MNQKEEMHNENNGGGGAGRIESSVSKSENGWVKYVAIGVIFLALAAGIILTFI